jgi:tetratricopeptide (TPR) repeat protein
MRHEGELLPHEILFWSSSLELDIVLEITNHHNLIHTEIMSLETQELRKIFSEIQAEFFNNEEIHVHPVSGDPPSQYEVSYDLPCTTQDDRGEIVIAPKHTVIISIPFGFPHFPPSCKPKSSIFHPDFDSAAICLGDFWHRQRTIPELIYHIGAMLRGEIFSTENTFNEEAAAWFLEHGDKLPFGKTQPVAAPDKQSGEKQEEDAAAESDEQLVLSLEPQEEPEISTMEDQDFMDDFHFADNIPEAPSSRPSSAASAQANVDSDRLRHLARKRNFKQLAKEIHSLPADLDFPGRSDLAGQAASAMREAQSLYEKAEEFENRGAAKEALECFRTIENLVADYGNIRADILRTEQAVEMLGEIAGQQASASAPEPAARSGRMKKAAESPGSTAEDSHKPRFFEDKVKPPVNIIPYVLTGGILSILAAVTYFYFALSSHLTDARQLFSECTSSFSAKNFQTAEQACSASLQTSKSVLLIHQKEVAELQAGIRRILDSEEMRQGLQGNILYNDKYVSKELLTTHKALQETVKQGNDYLEASSWDQAAASFQKAIEISRQLQDLNPDELMDIEQNLAYAAFRAMLTVAEEHVDKGEWPAAVTMLSDLQGQIGRLSPRQQVEFRDYVDKLLAKSRFTTLKQQADTLFSQSDWAGAATLFQKAVEAGRSLSETETQDLSGLQANITRAELYSTINAGNSAFASGQWDAAIEKYRRASAILDNNAGLLNMQEIEQSRRKLDRIILQSSIIRDRQIAEKSKATDNTARVDEYLRKVIDVIQASRFSDDPEFKEIVAETRLTQKNLKQQRFLKEKEQYLIDNYKTLFMNNYPAATPETLESPVASFERLVGKRYLFKVQCTESGRGRPLKLIMYYAFDPDNGSWQFYSEN